MNQEPILVTFQEVTPRISGVQQAWVKEATGLGINMFRLY